jgi:hypothetical protein
MSVPRLTRILELHHVVNLKAWSKFFPVELRDSLAERSYVPINGCMQK